MIYAIDIDETLCVSKDGHYSKYVPVAKAIAKVNQLYDQGHIIKVFTARGAASGTDWRDLTKKQLDRWGLKYHLLLMDKPDADVFIDDKAINTEDWLKSNTLVMIVGERGAGKSTIRELFEKLGFCSRHNEFYYLKYGELHPDIEINQDEALQDKIYKEVELELIDQLEESNVVYEATGANKRWLPLRDRMSQIYDVVVVRVSSAVATERYLARGAEHNYPSTFSQLNEIKEKVSDLKVDYEVDNCSNVIELDIRVEGIVQKIKSGKLVAVSGAFDPVHIGHIRYFEKARELGNSLVVVMRNDESVLLKKDYVFMPELERKEVLESIRYVDAVVVTVDKDQSSNRTIELLRPDIYAKGGDRQGKSEAETCRKIGCEIITNIVPTYQSSSKLVDNVRRMRSGY